MAFTIGQHTIIPRYAWFFICYFL